MTFLNQHDLTIVIVTYGDRRKYLRKTIPALTQFQDLISNIILVQNGQSYDLQVFINNLKINGLKIVPIIEQDNLGSGGGFSVGLQKALLMDGSKVLILDDDNYVPEESFKKMREDSFEKKMRSYGDKIAISMYRPQHDQDVNKFLRDYDYNINFLQNTVCQFSLMHKINKNGSIKKRLCKDIAELAIAPYSGLVLSKSYISSVEKIQINYFVYGDDTRFTARLTQSGVRIVSPKEIYVIDLEKSWYQAERGTFCQKNDVQLLLSMERKDELWRPFYRIRNGVCSSKEVFKKNPFIFWGNLILFIIGPFFLYMPKTKRGFKNYIYFLRAVWDGIMRNLGRKPQCFFK